MLPTLDQIQQAAYYRWEHRGGEHGQDRADWLAAEQDLLFALNYRVIAEYRLDGERPQVLGNTSRRKCRFCEMSAPRVKFGEPHLAIPRFLGNTALFASDQCVECRDLFRDVYEHDLAVFARPFLDRGRSNGNGGMPRSKKDERVPLAVFKGLTWLALAVLPEREMSDFDDAVEWVSNPSHESDAALFDSLSCHVHPAHGPGSSWTALARRLEDDAPVPYMLFFLGTPGATFQLALPLCARDEDLDGQRVIVPRMADALAIGRRN